MKTEKIAQLRKALQDWWDPLSQLLDEVDPVEPEMRGQITHPSFEQELVRLLNRHSKENESNTPDFLLAHYLLGCLNAYNLAVNQRDEWYRGEKPLPTDAGLPQPKDRINKP